MVRRLARKAKAGDAFVHAALRLAAKQHVHASKSSWRDHKSFRANLDTPSDIQANYLQNPHDFGLSRFSDVLSWAQQASSATLLKMTRFRGAALLVLMERNHGQAVARLNVFMENSSTDELNDLKSALLAPKAPWSLAAVQAFSQLPDAIAHRLWYKNVELLKRFQHEALLQGQVGMPSAVAKRLMGSYPMVDLMLPWPSLPMQSAALETAWERIAIAAGNDPDGVPASASEWKAWAQQGLDSWQAHNPTPEQCMQLALALDACVPQCANHIRENMAHLWRERPDWLEPWIRMVGNTVHASEEAWSMYKSIDPDLLSFSSLAVGSIAQLPEPVPNLSELLCP